MKGRKTGGRTKGTPNKVNAALRDMILGALAGVGGQKYLERQAKENPGPFMTLVGKVLPTEVTGAEGAPLIPSSVQIVLSAQDGADNRT